MDSTQRISQRPCELSADTEFSSTWIYILGVASTYFDDRRFIKTNGKFGGLRGSQQINGVSTC